MGFFVGFDKEHIPAYGKNWGRFFAIGTLLLLIGLIAISASTFTTLLSVVTIGFILFLSGFVVMIDTFSFWRNKGSGFFMHLVFALLYLIAGLYLIINPVAGSISLTFLLGVFYIAVGFFKILFSSTVRAPKWGYFWFNGLISILLGFLILLSWPSSALFVIGLFVGIDLVFAGWAYIMAAMAAKKLMS